MWTYHFNLTEIVWLCFVFIFGASVGSLLNVVVGRLPLQKSILWPPSRCGKCFQRIRMLDNLPILSYLILRGRCRNCHTPYSSRYLWIELGTGLAFTLLFALEILYNIHAMPFIQLSQMDIFFGSIPLKAWVMFLHHAILLAFLIAAAMCDFDGRIIPLPLTITGTLIGLMSSAFIGWPWPNDAGDLINAPPFPLNNPWSLLDYQGKLILGAHPWPVWGPLPSWLPAGSAQLGFLTALVGAAMGTFLLRSVKFVFEKGLRKEALGLGDADLMMMAGAFLGWQIITVGFFIGSVVALLLIVPFALNKNDRSLPFGPGLALGIVITWLSWRWMGAFFQPFLFDIILVLLIATLLGGGMFISSLILGLLHPKTVAPTNGTK